MWACIFTVIILWGSTTGVNIMFPHFSSLIRVAIYILTSIILYVFGNELVILLTVLHNIIFSIIFGKRALLNQMHNIGEKNRKKHK
ncbi:hypothetical protein G15_0104 [Enterococcus avium]|nr:hypothetical protein G15_0104 [Enterococcus avium]